MDRREQDSRVWNRRGQKSTEFKGKGQQRIVQYKIGQSKIGQELSREDSTGEDRTREDRTREDMRVLPSII